VKKTRTRFERFIINICIAVAAVFFCLAAIELSLRITGFTWHDSYGSGPGNLALQKSARKNSLGFRDIDYASPAPPRGATRIIVLGDSFAWGSGVNNDKAVFSAPRLPAELARHGVKAQTLNASALGANTAKELVLYRKAHKAFNESAVVLCFFANDIEPVGGAPEIAPVLKPNLPFIPQVFTVHSALLHFVNIRAGILRERRGRKPSYSDYLHAIYRNKAYLKENSGILGLIDKEVRANGSRLFIVALPVVTDEKPYPFPEATDYIRAQADKLGAPFLDLGPAILKHPVEKMRAGKYDAHFSAAAHAVAAREIARFIVKETKRQEH